MALVAKADLDQVRDALGRWLAGRIPNAGVTITHIDVPASAGFSNETVFADIAWRHDGRDESRSLVVRMQQPGPGLFPSYHLDQQWQIMSALHRDGVVAVPEPLWMEDDAAPLGAPFYVMSRVEGRAALDDPPYTAAGWFIELSPPERAVVADNGLQAMAQVHATDLERHHLSAVERPGTGDPLDREIGYYQRFFEWAIDGDRHPTVEGAFAWVRDHRPTTAEPVVLSWGDARLGNLLVRRDLSLSAVLDWEMASLGSPILDLGWWLFMQRHHTEGYGIAHPDGLPGRDETIKRYEQLSGHSAEHIDFYEAFAALRGSVIMTRLAKMMIDAGMLPPDADVVHNNPGSRILAHLTGQPAPIGTGLTGHVGRG